MDIHVPAGGNRKTTGWNEREPFARHRLDRHRRGLVVQKPDFMSIPSIVVANICSVYMRHKEYKLLFKVLLVLVRQSC